MKQRIVPSKYQQAVLSIPETINLLLAGGRAGGKSFCLMMLLLRHVTTYGEAANALLVRHSYDAIKEIESDFELMASLATGNQVKHNKTEHTFYFPNGGKVQFGQIAEQKDYVKYHGKSFTLLIVDEYGEIVETRWVNMLATTLRAPKGIPLRIIWAANPGGPQHGFLYNNFIQKHKPWTVFEYNGERWMYCPSTLVDNTSIDQEAYKKKLVTGAGSDKDLLRAWLTGNWDIARGAYFGGVLDERIHKLTESRFPLRNLYRTWKPYLSMDWGSGAPSVCYVVAESPGINGFPKGSLILCDELATCESIPDRMNAGLHWPPSKLAEAVLQLAKKWGCPPEGVSDDANGLEDTLLERFEEYGLYLVKPTKDRLSGWAGMRNLLDAAKERNGNPGMWIHERCEYFWNSVPYLQRDVKHPEDIVTKNAPDHGADACFVQGTEIATQFGAKPIEALRARDRVYTRSGLCTIERTGSRIAPTFRVTLSDGTWLDATEDHPFYTRGGWVPVHSLEPGDILTTGRNRLMPVHVAWVEPTGKEEMVYNIQVADCPEYFANGILVHNCRYAVMYRDHGAVSGSLAGDF